MGTYGRHNNKTILHKQNPNLDTEHYTDRTSDKEKNYLSPEWLGHKDRFIPMKQEQ